MTFANSGADSHSRLSPSPPVSRSDVLTVRGLRTHVRAWGEAHQPMLFLLHGWMDASASFQFLVESFEHEWQVLAPDFRGFGHTEWPQDGYWFPDYLGDLDVILEHYSPHTPVHLIGHSMGGNVACLYAGVRPERVATLSTLEGFGLIGATQEEAPQRLRQWLAELREPMSFRPYASEEEYAQRLRQNAPRMTDARARFIAKHSLKRESDGRFELRSDPRHKRKNATLYRIEEAMACWRAVSAPTLWVAGADSKLLARHLEAPEDYARRKACFRDLTERIIAESGHMMHQEQPEALAKVIEDFLSTHEHAQRLPRRSRLHT